MAQIGNIPEIIEVKNYLDKLKKEGLIAEWELPYENLLTRISAAVFFVLPQDNISPERIWEKMKKFENFCYTINDNKEFSLLPYRVEFKEKEM